MRAALLVLAFIGSATSEATPEQRDRLRHETLPPLYDETLPASEAYEKAIRTTAEIMGTDWRPKGEWDSWITALLEEKGTMGS